MAAAPERWAACGFSLAEDGTIRLGATRIRPAGSDAGRGVVGWSLRGLGSGVADLDGLPIIRSTRPPAPGDRHRNRAQAVDHVVAFTPVLDRTVPALERAGFDLRRVRGAVLPGGGTRQAFFRLGEVILEVVEQPAKGGSPRDPSLSARLWGLALSTPDLDATAAQLGDRLGEPRDALQPGRRIGTVRREAGLGMAVAFITPPPG